MGGLVTPGHEEVRGQAATEGGIGGRVCTGGSGPGSGGFGGGGGGCRTGGAGGGWAGTINSPITRSNMNLTLNRF